MTNMNPETVGTYWDMKKDPGCAVRVWNMTHYYGRQKALDSVNLNVRKGDVFGLIGPNGAGKTTLLRVLATLLEPTKGQAYVMRHSVRKEPHWVRLNIGFMPDSTGIKEDLQVSHYLYFYSALYRVDSSIRSRVISEALDVVGLSSRRSSRISELSLGMQQRLSLARLLIHNPKVLLLDEPASGLDPAARIELKDLIVRLAGLGKTVIVSSHVLGDIGRIANRVGIIERGRMLFSGPISDLLSGSASGRKFRINLAKGEPADAAALLSRLFPLVATGVCQGGLWAQVVGGPEEPARIFSALVRAGFVPSHYQEEQEDLEAAFLRLTKGDVA